MAIGKNGEDIRYVVDIRGSGPSGGEGTGDGSINSFFFHTSEKHFFALICSVKIYLINRINTL